VKGAGAAGPGRWVLLAALCAGGGCAGSLFQSKALPPTTYLLSAKLAGTPDAIVAADLAVQRPRVRTGLESDRIAVLYADRRMDYIAGARWSGPLDLVVQDLAVQAFDTGAHLRNVGAETSAFPSGYWLEIRVVDFQAEYATAESVPAIHVRLSARLGAAGDRRILGTFDADSVRPAAANRLKDIIDAYERAADDALAQIVAGTSHTLTGALEER